MKDKLKHYRISEDEFRKITDLLGHEPKGIEWALFSALWSEHCSYKSSKVHLKKFASTLNEKSMQLSGENAGVVDLGQSEKIVFKMESHNHPSFIEPYQGAATGVGGILRDIFTMGARPIALADFLCFGEPKAHRMSFLVDGVVKGISGYGNSVGVPTITGQTQFDESYDTNILVNAMAVGFLGPNDKVALSGAKGVGNCIVYVGAKTGKDGVHGAAMASESFDENSEAKKPNVQIGDPYFEKLLIESCLEVLGKDLVVSIQDMGAAGLTSSSFEMASKGQIGMKINLDQVPLRDSSMTPEEILLSESQERMLLICEPTKLPELTAVFQHWGLDAVVIGQLQQKKTVDLWWHGEQLVSIDPDLLTENAPQYQRAFNNWVPKNEIRDESLFVSHLELSDTILKKYFSSAKGGSKSDIYRQYDQRVGLLTVRGADHDVAFIRLPESRRGLSMAVGCRTPVMKLDARLGAIDSVLYSAFQMAIKGASPVAITDCLNFGNPEKIDIMTEFVTSVESIKECSLALGAPVVSGNVSFYNETLGKNITSTPAIGILGLRDHVDRIPQDTFQKLGSKVYLLGRAQVLAKGLWVGQVDLPTKYYTEKDSKNWVQEWSASISKFKEASLHEAVLSSQMISLGGLISSISKMSFSGLGFKMNSDWSNFDLSRDVFYQALFEVDQSQSEKFEQHCQKLGVSMQEIGSVVADTIQFRKDLSFSVQEIKQHSDNGLRGQIENMA